MIEFYTKSPPVGGICTITPFKDGLALATLFTIECLKFTDSDYSQLYYAVFQDGRLLNESTDNIQKLRLKGPSQGRGTSVVQIKVSNSYGMASYVNISIEIKDLDIPNNFNEIITFLNESKIIPNLRNVTLSGDISTACVLIDHLTQKINNKTNDDGKNENYSKLVEILIDHLKILNIKTMTSIVLVVDTLNNVYTYEIEIAFKSVQILNEIVVETMKSIYTNNNNNNKLLSRETFEKTAELLIEFCNKLILPIKKIEIPLPNDDDNGDDDQMDDYKDYGEMNVEKVKELVRLEYISDTVEKVLSTLGKIASQKINYREPDMRFNGQSFNYSVQIVSAENFTDVEFYPGSGVHVLIDRKLLMNLRKIHGAEFAIETTFFKINPFWWFPQSSSQIINQKPFKLSFYGGASHEQSRTVLKNPIRYSMDMNHGMIGSKKVIHGFVNKEFDMPIYKLKLRPGRLIQFNFIINDLSELKVNLKVSQRPNYFDLTKNFIQIINGSTIKYQNATITAVTPLYLAIIPDQMKRVNFSILIKEFSCLVWSNNHGNWDSDEFCQIDLERTTDDRIHCLCYHLSIFTAGTSEVSVDLELERNVKSSLDVNLFIYVMLTVLLIVYVAVMKWAWKKDEKDLIEMGQKVKQKSKPKSRGYTTRFMRNFTNEYWNIEILHNIFGQSFQSVISRKMRLTLLLVELSFLIMINVLLLGPSTIYNHSEEHLKYRQVYFSLEILWIIIQSMLLSYIFRLILFHIVVFCLGKKSQKNVVEIEILSKDI